MYKYMTVCYCSTRYFCEIRDQYLPGMSNTNFHFYDSFHIYIQRGGPACTSDKQKKTFSW